MCVYYVLWIDCANEGLHMVTYLYLRSAAAFKNHKGIFWVHCNGVSPIVCCLAVWLQWMFLKTFAYLNITWALHIESLLQF